MGNPKCGTTKSLQEKDPSASSNKEIAVCKCVSMSWIFIIM